MCSRMLGYQFILEHLEIDERAKYCYIRIDVAPT